MIDTQTDTDRDIERERLRASLKSRLFGEAVAIPRVGRYRLGLPVGEGATGTVYRAEDPDLDRPVALKLLRAPTDTTAQRRLVAEAQALARLNHPHVVTVHEVGRDEGQLFIAMEFVEGSDLGGWMKRNPPGARSHFSQVLQLMLAGADGLVAAHAAGVIHRDLKPGNMLIDAQGRLRLADFGLATSGAPQPKSHTRAQLLATAGATLGAGLTATGSVVGTPAYMAPEQFEGVTDERSDQFSFCVTFFEVLYGRRPYEGNTVTALLEAYAQGEIATPASTGVPRWAAAVLRRGLAPEASRRFATMAELRAALRRGARRARRRPWWLLGGLAVATAGTWAVTREPGVAPCAVSAERLDDAWGPARQQAMRGAIERTEIGAAPQVAERTGQILDDWAEQWATDRARNCEALRHDPHNERLAVEQECLRRAVVAVDELTDAAVSLDAAQVRLLPETALMLVDQQRCDQPVLAGSDDADDGELARAVARAHALAGLQRTTEAEKEARHAALEAERRGLPRTFARAATVLAEIERHRSQPESSRSWAERGLASAEQAGDLVLQFEAWHQLAKTARSQGNAEQASFALRRARSIVERLGDDAARRQALMWTEAMVDEDHGNYEGAMRGFEAAYRQWDGNPLTRGGILCDLGRVQETHATLAEARDSRQQCMVEFERAYGEDSPQLAVPAAMLGQTHLRLGEIEAGLRYYEQADRGFASSPGYQPTLRGGVAVMLGQIYRDLGRTEDAQAALDRAIAVLDGVDGAEANVQIARTTLAALYIDTKQYERAAVELEAVIADEPPGASKLPTAGSPRLYLAEAHAYLGHTERARRWAREARALMELPLREGTVPHADMLRVVADVYAIMGAHAEALELTEQALRVADFPAPLRAETEWIRARALAGLGRSEEAEALARRARGVLAAGGPATEDVLVRLDAWWAEQAWAEPGAEEGQSGGAAAQPPGEGQPGAPR